jgi:hypothetical protein
MRLRKTRLATDNQKREEQRGFAGARGGAFRSCCASGISSSCFSLALHFYRLGHGAPVYRKTTTYVRSHPARSGENLNRRETTGVTLNRAAGSFQTSCELREQPPLNEQRSAQEQNRDSAVARGGEPK